MDIICFCHLRWNFVYQRPQHLMSRFAQHANVVIIEEPIYDAEMAFLEQTKTHTNIRILVPHLPTGRTPEESLLSQQQLVNDWFHSSGIKNYIAWLYTPMALPLSESLPPADLLVYDCMDELSAFKNAPDTLRENETKLFQKADLVFTGGYSLYAAKKHLHTDIHPFPSSIDKHHFGMARTITEEPVDQQAIPHPRIGFFGVIDERMDIALLQELAIKKPEWHFVMVGPVVKIDPAMLPVAENIHYLGARSYEELTAYLSGWDVAFIPFALNESTRFISPTKTPEYLAGGIPVVSTPLSDVIKPYGENELVYIAGSADDFIRGIHWCMERKTDTGWLSKVDDFLADTSWDITWINMTLLIQKKLANVKPVNLVQKEENDYV